MPPPPFARHQIPSSRKCCASSPPTPRCPVGSSAHERTDWTLSLTCRAHELKLQDRQGSWQPAMQQQTHSHGNWSDSSASHRIATPHFNPRNGSAGPHGAHGAFISMHGHSSMQSMYDNQAPPLLRRNHSAGQPSWLQGGNVPVRVSSASMDVFASTGGGGGGTWGLSQSAEMLVI